MPPQPKVTLLRINDLSTLRQQRELLARGTVVDRAVMSLDIHAGE
jgi:hypothetical protein